MDSATYQQSMLDEVSDIDLRGAAIAMLEGREILDPIFLLNYLGNAGLCDLEEKAQEIIRVAKAHPETMAELEGHLDFSHSTIKPDCDEGDFEAEAVMRFVDLVDLTGLAPFLSEKKLKELTAMANRNIMVVKEAVEKFECLWDKAAQFRDMLRADRLSLAQHFVGEIVVATDWVLRGVDRPATGDRAVRLLRWA